jgi:hypothetical protein
MNCTASRPALLSFLVCSLSRRLLLVTWIGLLLAVPANRGWAVPIAVTAEMFDSGFFHEDGRSSKEDGEMMGLPTTPPGFANYHVGLSAGYGIVDPDPLTYTDVETRNFFVFDFGELLAPFGGEVPSLPPQCHPVPLQPGCANRYLGRLFVARPQRNLCGCRRWNYDP